MHCPLYGKSRAKAETGRKRGLSERPRPRCSIPHATVLCPDFPQELMLKHSGELPIIGVNTFLDPDAVHGAVVETELIRSTDAEKDAQVEQVARLRDLHRAEAEQALIRLREAAEGNDNVFAEMMETVKVCTLGQISHALYEVGGQYRRNM